MKRSVSPWRYLPALGMVNGKLYLVGGTRGVPSAMTRVDAYDITSNAWSQVASLPSPRYELAGASMINGKLYVAGGINGNGAVTKTLFVYNPGTNKWSRKADLPQAVCGRGAQGAIAGKLYVYVGCYASLVNARVFFRYDPATDIWIKRAAPPVDHVVSGAGAAVAGKFYLVSGRTAGGTFISQLDAYDPATNTWAIKAGIGPIPRGSAAAGSATSSTSPAACTSSGRPTPCSLTTRPPTSGAPGLAFRMRSRQAPLLGPTDGSTTSLASSTCSRPAASPAPRSSGSTRLEVPEAREQPFFSTTRVSRIGIAPGPRPLVEHRGLRWWRPRRNGEVVDSSRGQSRTRRCARAGTRIRQGLG